MPNIGDTVRFESKFLKRTGSPLTGAVVHVSIYDPTDALKVNRGTATEKASGRYAYDFAVDRKGFWVADFETTDPQVQVAYTSTRIWVDIAGALTLSMDTEQFAVLVDLFTSMRDDLYICACNLDLPPQSWVGEL